jgi:hypothetical protein
VLIFCGYPFGFGFDQRHAGADLVVFVGVGVREVIAAF